MRLVAICGAALVLAVGAFAQGHRGVGTSSGFGNILYPGTGRPPANGSGFGNVAFPGGRVQPRLPFSITDTTFGQRLSGTVSGSRPYRGGRGGGVVYMPYVYPVYMGGYGAYEQEPQQPNVIVVYPQQQQQQPVVINQQFAPVQEPAQEQQPSSSEIRVYQAPTRTAQEMPASEPAVSGYLFAFKDHSIYSAVAYWVEGETLHYFTNGTTHNQVSLSLIDRSLTERLNRERGVEMRLPANQ